MSEGKHTPGPWEIGELDMNGQRIVRGEHIEICTCWHHCVGSIEREMEENARLIASAPDMLEALEEALEWDGVDDYGVEAVWANKARAAVSKAKGINPDE